MAQKIEVEFELKYKDALKNIDKLKKEYSELEKEVVTPNTFDGYAERLKK